jgi:hypothetical protein
MIKGRNGVMGEREEVNVDKLIAIEWDMMTDLRLMLNDPKLEAREKIRVANALAYHATVLNKLLAKKGESFEFDEETLGDYVMHYADGRMRRCVRREFRGWQRRLTLRK